MPLLKSFMESNPLYKKLEIVPAQECDGNYLIDIGTEYDWTHSESETLCETPDLILFVLQLHDEGVHKVLSFWAEDEASALSTLQRDIKIFYQTQGWYPHISYDGILSPQVALWVKAVKPSLLEVKHLKDLREAAEVIQHIEYCHKNERERYNAIAELGKLQHFLSLTKEELI